MTALVWFRRDLRLTDHPGLAAAVARGAVVPVFVWQPTEDPVWPPGAATRWYLQRSLAALAASLTARGSRLILATGDPREVLPRLAGDCGADAVLWSRRHEPAALRSDAAVEVVLRSAGIEALPHAGNLLAEPWDVTNGAGGPYRVFTPYWRAWLAQQRVFAPLPAPETLPAPRRWPASATVESLGIAPDAPWHRGLAARWTPGEGAALAELQRFTTRSLEDYAASRDRTDLAAVSGLSPRLHHGELSPRQVWTAIGRAAREAGLADEAWRGSKFCSELIWREFAAHVLYHYPELPDRSFDERYERLDWRDAPAELEAWRRGRTGVAMVDAGMRELWATGWMHNRARMICASFLVKNLLVHWREGARWFWDTLVDADLANNTLNWQWVAGTGPDASPWFRIFNPETQAGKFDPQGEYRRRWLGPSGTSGVAPIVDLAATRKRALAVQRSL